MKWLRDELVRHFEQLETERDQLRARVAELEEHNRMCAIVDEAIADALLRGLQEIAVIIGDDDPSPASVVRKVTAVVARVGDLEAEVERLKGEEAGR